MTNGTTKTKAASNGGTATDHPAAREHGIAVLRSIESKGLVTLAQDALNETYNVGHELHAAIYGYESDLADADFEQLLCEALTCLETADHYLRMLGSVLDERKAQNSETAGSGLKR